MIHLRQIRRAELPARWPEVCVPAEAVLEHSSGYTTDWLYRKSISGIMLILEVLRDGGSAGYVFGQLDSHSEIRAFYLFGVWLAGRFRAEEYRELRDVLDALAVHLGAQAVRAKSPRRGWERLAERLGFEPIATEYERKVA